jgi:hypothetical protein
LKSIPVWRYGEGTIFDPTSKELFMDHSPVAVDVDPQELARSQALWSVFMECAKYGVIAVAVLLSLMAIFLV